MAVPGGKPSALIREETAVMMDAQPVVELCSRCDWRFEGLVSEGRDAFLAHVADVHPDVRVVRGVRASQAEKARARARLRALDIAARKDEAA